eukprot:UN24935
MKWIQKHEQAVLHSIGGVENERSTVHHLISDTSGTEEDLQYSEQLFWLPWNLEVTVIYPSSRNEIVLSLDCFFDYNMMVQDSNGKLTSIGCGIVGTALDNRNRAKSFHIDDNAAIIVRINISEKVLDKFFGRKTRERIARLHERKHVNESSSLISKEGVYWIFEESKAQSGRKAKTSLEKVYFKIDIQTYTNGLVRLMPHFYNEIAKTDRGIKYMQESGDIERLIKYIKKNIDPGVSEEANLKLRGALWAIGMFGSSQGGFEYLDRGDTIKFLAETCMKSQILSIKSTLLIILGLFTRNPKGEERLKRLGFMSPPGNLENDLGIVLPKDLTTFFKITDNNYRGSWALANSNQYSVISEPDVIKPLNMR